MDQSLLAYSLSHVENGWRWSVYDEDGEEIAGGAQSDRDAAQDAVEQAMTGCGRERSAD